MVLAMRCCPILVYAMRLLPEAFSKFVHNVLCVFASSKVDPGKDNLCKFTFFVCFPEATL